MILVNLPNTKFIAFICSKTGSTTLRTLLLKYFNYKKIDINDYNGEEGCYEFANRNCEYLDFFDHCSPLDGLKLLEDKIDIKLFYKFGFIRKHIDRLISIFKFDKPDINFFEFGNRYYNKNNLINFNQYIEGIKAQKIKCYKMYNCDTYYFDENKNLVVDELYDFHDFNNEIKKLFIKLNNIILSDNDIPIINKTKNINIDIDYSLIPESFAYEKYLEIKNNNII
jgi:hypothetical protein